VKSQLSWFFEGRIPHRAKNATVIQLNLHSCEPKPTGVTVVIHTDFPHVVVTFRGPRALAEGHRCIAAVLDTIAERSDEAHPEAFAVGQRGPMLTKRADHSVEILLDGRIKDVVATFAAYFGSSLDNVPASMRAS